MQIYTLSPAIFMHLGHTLPSRRCCRWLHLIPVSSFRLGTLTPVILLHGTPILGQRHSKKPFKFLHPVVISLHDGFIIPRSINSRLHHSSPVPMQPQCAFVTYQIFAKMSTQLRSSAHNSALPEKIRKRYVRIRQL